MITDIVIGTYNRIDLLPRTLAHIAARTRTPYRLHVIDDGSADGTATYLAQQVQAGVVATILRRDQKAGIAANLRALWLITQSDPLIITDDDVLCPDVEPDWLARLLAEMASRPALGILALNNPQANVNVRGDSRRIAGRDGAVTLCRNVGATFALVRRAVLQAIVVPDDALSPLKHLCVAAGAAGFGVGYLTATYCQHIGAVSVRRDLYYGSELAMIMPLDKDTLEPPNAYKD